jgi:hypothetical protein
LISLSSYLSKCANTKKESKKDTTIATSRLTTIKPKVLLSMLLDVLGMSIAGYWHTA